MDMADKYAIPYFGLEPGEYAYSFTIGRDFFNAYEGSLIHEVDVSLEVRLTRRERILVLDLSFDGKVDLTCDRCLEPFAFPVELRRELVVKISEEAAEAKEEDVVIISEDDHVFRLGDHIYDYLSLLVPYRKLHPDQDGKAGCDPDAIRVLEAHTGKKSRGKDDRWDGLKKIKIDN